MSKQLVPDQGWLKTLHARAIKQPLRPRVPLWAGESVIGSVEPALLNDKALHEMLDVVEPLLQEEHPAELGWRLLGDVSTSLNQLARALYGAGLAGEWRNEQLAVHDQFDHLKGTVERAAVRPLGIATSAVHLVGQTPDGRHWVQQRSLKKSNDPGLWDTLMGGMVTAADTVEIALERETWEEAGLKISALQNLSHGGRVTTRRPSDDGKGTGYVIEDIAWYRCTVPEGVVPVNQDGEVAQFRLMAPEELLQALQRDEFTTEAALVLAEVLNLA
ncbi:MAG: NUDIX domain-containing protein [Polaromonas sp.]|uniref:NUDIX hydrolase n=1 Tax=Polaromonas sp. TaxID=1869339 RepID=UPI0025F3190F|nr:NUDIX domain-containing protein [Polaromonas sp.]MBI2727020.1 NUDIX domain-containing protein [Polaromonas sp.]